jgi:hypothetical protein
LWVVKISPQLGRVDLASTSHLLLINLRLFSNYGKPG